MKLVLLVPLLGIFIVLTLSRLKITVHDYFSMISIFSNINSNFSIISPNKPSTFKKMGNYKKKIGPKGRQRDIDSNYLKGAHSWNERMLKYSELCSLDFYLIKYEVCYKVESYSVSRLME